MFDKPPAGSITTPHGGRGFLLALHAPPPDRHSEAVRRSLFGLLLLTQLEHYAVASAAAGGAVKILLRVRN
jgi:hypothetical protein